MQTKEIHGDELEQMRHDMHELRSLLSEQKIVNEKMMRRAMSRDMGKERLKAIKTVVAAIIAMPLYYYLTPIWGIPMWLTWLTIAFLAVCCVATVWSVRRLLEEDLVTGDLLVVAQHITDYKRFGIRWLKFSIPFLCVWLSLLVHYVSLSADSEAAEGIIWGMFIGAIVGLVCGIVYLHFSYKRLNRIVKQIEEIKKDNE